MQQKAAASEHNTNTQKDGKMSYKLGPTEICPSNKKKKHHYQDHHIYKPNLQCNRVKEH